MFNTDFYNMMVDVVLSHRDFKNPHWHLAICTCNEFEEEEEETDWVYFDYETGEEVDPFFDANEYDFDNAVEDGEN